MKKKANFNFLICLFVYSVIRLFGYYSPTHAATKNFWNANLVNNIVVNPYQGLGLCHWVSPTILEDPNVSWAYDTGGATWWENIEPQENQFNWEEVDKVIATAKSKSKKLWILFLNNEGHVPVWATQKVVNGKVMQMMGNSNSFDQNGYPVCTSGIGPVKLPLPWNEAYLALWRKFVHKLAEKYDNNPDLEAVVMMMGGGYGEMSVCSTCGDTRCWAQAAGCAPTDETCVDQKYIQMAKDTLDLYLEKEHVWGNEGVLPSGTKTHGFQNKPVVLQLGGGVYHHTSAVIKPVLDYGLTKYGNRILLKMNGWNCGDQTCNVNTGGCDWGNSGVAQSYLNDTKPDLTKYGFEPGTWYSDLVLTQKMTTCIPFGSYACLQDFYWEGERAGNYSGIRTNLARSLGSKVALKEVTYPDSVTAGQSYNFSLAMNNLGEIPPFRPKREIVNNTPKDWAASYQMTFQFVKDGATVGHTEIEPNPSTRNWVKGQEIIFSSSVIIPNNLPTGNYELRIALFDPEAKIRYRQEFFRFLNKDILDSEGRAKIGNVNVLGTNNPNPSPTRTSSQSEDQSEDQPVNYLRLKAAFSGNLSDQEFLSKIFVKDTDLIELFILKDNEIYQDIDLESLTANQTYEFVLFSFPFLTNKKSLAVKSGANPSGSTSLNFGTLKTGDLNSDNQINGLDWSLMKGNFGESGDE